MRVGGLPSPPARVVWIEIDLDCIYRGNIYKSPPARVVWIEMIKQYFEVLFEESPPARVVWIEIERGGDGDVGCLVATREGGVD